MLPTKGTDYTNKRIDPSIIVLIAFAAWIAMQLLRRTWFAGHLNMQVSLDVTRCFCLVVLVIYEVVFGRRDRLSLIGLLVAIGMVALVLPIKHLIFFDAICFIYVSRDIPLRKMAKVSFITVTLLGSLVIISSLTGVIPNIVYESPDRVGRYALGFGHPNAAPAVFTHVFIVWAYLRDKKFGLIDATVILGIEAFLFYFTNSRTALILTVTLVITMLGFKYIHLRPIKSGGLKLLMAGIVVIVGIISITLSLAYNPNIKWIESLNSILSGRLYYSHWAIEEYGMHLFSQKVTFGAISNYDLLTGLWVESSNELVLDNLYVRIPIQCGLLFFVIALFITVVANLKLVAAKQYRLLSLITITAVYGIMENIPSFLFYNCLLVLMTLPLAACEDIEKLL